jgi:hypothetical protein
LGTSLQKGRSWLRFSGKKRAKRFTRSKTRA